MRSIDYNHRSKDQMTSPWALWADLRKQDGLHSDAYGGFHLVCRYADVFTALTDTDRFSSADGVQLPRFNLGAPLVPVEIDPPEHRAYRRVMNVSLSPHRVKTMRDWIRGLAVDLIGGFEQSRRVEFVSAYASPLPRQVAYGVLGFPAADFAMVNEWVNRTLHDADRDLVNSEVTPKMGAYLFEYVAGRRANGERRDDVIDELLHADLEDGRPFTDLELVSALSNLLFGGLHTTSAAVAGMVYWLAQHPEGRDRLRREPQIHRLAADEFVRWSTPIPHLVRTATTDTELGGCRMSGGEKVMVAFGSANHDPDEFECPDDVVLDRNPNRHFGFGAGPHRCVGSHLAKEIITITIEELLTRVPEFRLDDEVEIETEVGEATGLVKLPLILGS